MKYCINPLCEVRENPDDAENCLSCGTPLLINGRIRLIKPLRELNYNPEVRVEVFEVDDAGTKWDTKRRRRVMKVLKWGSDKIIELFEQESKILRILNHPCIPKSTIDDYFIVIPNKFPLQLRCLVMDKIEGEDLHKWIQVNGKISQSLAFDWMLQLMEIIDYIHHREIFHRDIKPSNIILQPDGKLVLVDFGGARRITDTYLAKVSASGGTSMSMSNYEITAVVSTCFTPLEQINGKAVPQSDFYALGRTLVYLVTGKPLIKLFTDDNTGKLNWRKYAPQIDKPFANLIDEMMAPFPGQRPQTTEIILQRLERLPVKIKFYRKINSKFFLLSLTIFTIVTSVGSFQGIKLALSNYYYNVASLSRDDPKLAIKNYKLAIKFNPQDVGIYNNLALACQLISDIKCMNSNYEKVFQLQPNYWVSYYNLANYYETQGEYEKAEHQYKLAIHYSDNQAMNAVSNLARLKNRDGKYDEAAALAIQGLSRTQNPEWQAGLYKNLGWARFEQQRYAEAEDFLRKSVKLDSKRVDAYCLLAQIYEAQRNFKKTELYWDICLTANSDLPEVLKWRQQLLQRLLKQK